MPNVQKKRRWLFVTLGIFALFYGAVWFSQTVIAHRDDPFVPDYPQKDLTALLNRENLSGSDYATLFLQTGLGEPAVDALRAQGDLGIAQLLDTQSQFFAPRTVVCAPLFGPLVEEDHMEDENGAQTWAPPMVALKNGDVLLTFATHSFGWRHGHAGLVTDSANGHSLEAAVIGSDSALMDAGHWRAYSSYMVLRLRDMTETLQTQLVDTALQQLNGVPYHISSGFFGPKAPTPDASYFGVQCAYLVWYAFQQFGYDLDSDGGRLVSVYDLSQSPLFEVVQIYGMDPQDWM